MSGIIVVAEHRQGELTPGSLECIVAATQLKAETSHNVLVAVLASDPGRFSESLNLEGVDEIIGIAVPDDEFQVDIYESAISGLINAREPALVLVPHSVDAWSYAPVVAARGNFGFATDVFGMRFEDGRTLRVPPHLQRSDRTFP